MADGGTALYDALYDSLAQVGVVKGRRVVVVVTDGRDEDNPGTGPGSRHTWTEVLQKLQQSEAIVYAVGLGARVDRVRLETLADESGGSGVLPIRRQRTGVGLPADPGRVAPPLRGGLPVDRTAPGTDAGAT